MEKSWKERAGVFLKMQKKKKWLYSIIGMMALVVICMTTYMLIRPAVTAEKSNGCEWKVHEHTKECYDEEQNLSCGYADFVVHTHDRNCYNEEGILLCSLPEIKEHMHDSSCYTEEKELICGREEKEGHMHQGECYEKQKGELNCVLEEHTHGVECYDEQGNLICEKQEHVHTDSCYPWKDVLICTKEESPGHTHTDECYRTKQELVCQKPEVILHTHTDECYRDGKLVCGKNEIQKHQHTEKCFEKEKSESKDTGNESALELNQVTEDEQANLENEVLSESNDNTETVLTEPTGTPIQVDSYIKKFQLSYQNKENDQWITITDDTQNVPGDATVLLQINYEGVEIQDLVNAGYQMQYTLPPLLKEPTVSGVLTSGQERIGTIVSVKNSVILRFDEAWIKKQSESGHYQISGDFYIKSQFDGTSVEEGKPGEITIGDVTIQVHFEDDVAAKHGKVTIEKSKPEFKEESNGCYLTYTLTVQVPEGAAAVPEVKVVDQFTKNKQYVEEYVGVTGIPTSTSTLGLAETYPESKEAGEVYLGNTVTQDQPIPEPAGGNLTKPGILVWSIGQMTAGEKRTLTYRVKLTDNYKAVNFNHNSNAIMNEASVYSKIYLRENSESNYTPNIQATLRKTAGEYTPNEGDHGGTITYKIWVQADPNNTYTIDNVKVTDYFQTTKFVPYVDYDENSFHLYEGNETTGSEIPLNNVKPDNNIVQNPVIKTNMNANNTEQNPQKKFDLYIGSLEPGEEKTVTYTVKVKPDIWVISNQDIKLENRAKIFSDDRWTDGNKPYEAYSCKKIITGKIWSRKVVGEFIKEAKTIKIPKEDPVYDQSLQPVVSPPENFQVPAYSQEYQLVVNEEGIWDFSNVEFQDTLKESQMQHSGYLKLEAYKVTNPVTGKVSDQEAINNITKGTLEKTVWLDIDKQSSFSFQPSKLGLKGKYAYIVTYYASLQNPEKHHHIVIHNDFIISGDAIGPNGKTITIPGITVDTAATIQGENHYKSEKTGWYYERPQAEAEQNWKKGELYWAIKVSGNHIPEGMKVKDTIKNKNLHKMYPKESLVGIYKGSFPDGKTLKDFKNLRELDSVSGLQKLEGVYSQGLKDPNKDYRWDVRENQYLFIEFNKEMVLNEKEGEALYAIIKTAPQQLPQGKRDSKDFSNSLQTYHSGSDQWKDEQDAKLTVYGSDKIFKETQGAYTYDGSTWKTLVSGKRSDAGKLDKKLIKDPGTYIEWLVHINWDGTMSGLAEIEDQLPKGVELTYVRYYWYSNYYRGQGQKVPETLEIQELNSSSEWVKKETSANIDHSQEERKCTYYYNKETGKVRWNVKPLVSGGNKNDERAVEFQVVCKVTDQDALMSGKDVTMNNTVTVTNNGETDTDSDGITIRKDTLHKKGVYNENTDGGSYPFQIELNPLGEDLVPNAEKVTIVDELSATLTLDPRTVKVVERKSNTDITDQCHAKIDNTTDGQIMYLTVPDSANLIVTYRTFVNAKPGQAIAISNKAHWEGYGGTDSGNVSIPNFSYSAGGSAGADKKPSLKVIKMDKEHALHTLAGAEFSVQEVTETLEPVGEKRCKKTDEKGEAVFSVKATENRWMKFNTIYCLKEEKAPSGYVKDDTPYYFAIAKESDANGNKKFPENVHVEYQNPQYTYIAYNQQGEIKVDKKFQKADGTSLEKPLNGSYQFGIFDNESGAESPLQTLTITYLNGQATYQRDGHEVTEPVFTQLDVDKSTKYYVFELSDDGKLIKNGQMATVDGKTFEVTYRNNDGVSLDANNNGKSTIVVTNKVKQFKLPETGGKGTRLYMLAGIMFLTISAFGFIFQKKKIRRMNK